MAGLLTWAITYLIVKKLDKMTEYKIPKGKHKRRYL